MGRRQLLQMILVLFACSSEWESWPLWLRQSQVYNIFQHLLTGEDLLVAGLYLNQVQLSCCLRLPVACFSMTSFKMLSDVGYCTSDPTV